MQVRNDETNWLVTAYCAVQRWIVQLHIYIIVMLDNGVVDVLETINVEKTSFCRREINLEHEFVRTVQPLNMHDPQDQCETKDLIFATGRE